MIAVEAEEPESERLDGRDDQDVAGREAHARRRQERQRARNRDVGPQEEAGAESADGDREIAREAPPPGTRTARRAAIRSAPSASRPDGCSRRAPQRHRARARRSSRRNNRASRAVPPSAGRRRVESRRRAATPSTHAPAVRRAGTTSAAAAAASAASGASHRAALRETKASVSTGCGDGVPEPALAPQHLPGADPDAQATGHFGRGVARRRLAGDGAAGEDDARALRARPAPGSGSRPSTSCPGEAAARARGAPRRSPPLAPRQTPSRPSASLSRVSRSQNSASGVGRPPGRRLEEEPSAGRPDARGATASRRAGPRPARSACWRP